MPRVHYTEATDPLCGLPFTQHLTNQLPAVSCPRCLAALHSATAPETPKVQRWNDRESIEYAWPFEPALVQALKDEIPASARRFDPATKRWRVHRRHQPKVERLLSRFFRPQSRAAARSELGLEADASAGQIYEAFERRCGGGGDHEDGEPSEHAVMAWHILDAAHQGRLAELAKAELAGALPPASP